MLNPCGTAPATTTGWPARRLPAGGAKAGTTAQPRRATGQTSAIETGQAIRLDGTLWSSGHFAPGWPPYARAIVGAVPWTAIEPHVPSRYLPRRPPAFPRAACHSPDFPPGGVPFAAFGPGR